MIRARAFIILAFIVGVPLAACFAASPLASTITYRDGTSSTTQPVWQVATAWDDSTITRMTDPAAAPVTASTISVGTNTALGPATGTLSVRVASPQGRNVDAVRVPPGVTNALVRNLIVETSGSKIASAVSVSGTNCKVSNVTQAGTGRLLTFSGAVGLDADLLIANNGKQSEYGIYAGGDSTPNIGCRLRRLSLWVGPGDSALAGSNGQQHGIRVHNHHDLTIGDALLRLSDLPQWSFFIRDTSAYPGCGITLKEGSNALIQYGRCDGPIGFGPLDVSRAIHPDWKLDGLTISHCEINTPSYVHFGWNVVNVLVTDSTIRAVAQPVNDTYDLTKIHGSCLIIDPASAGKFVRTAFFGERLCDASNVPNLQHWTFDSCTFNSKPLGLHGE